MPTVISDSSTIIHLAKIGKLQLLREFYNQVMLPPAVWKEVVEEGHNRAGVSELEEAKRKGWILVIGPLNRKIITLLKRNLDEGESEAVALAIEKTPALLLIDESDARKIARLYNIKITGVIGILIRAKREGKIRSVKTELDKLIRDGNFWIDDQLYRHVLKETEEL